MQALSPEEEVVHLFTAVLVFIEQRQVVACAGFLFCICCRYISLCTRLVDGMILVVAGFCLTIVRQVAILTRTEIGDTRVLARDGILAVSILIVTVGIIVVDVLQCLLVFLLVMACAGTQVVAIQIVCHLAILEVFKRIATVSRAVHSIYNRFRRGRGILEAAVVFTRKCGARR